MSIEWKSMWSNVLTPLTFFKWLFLSYTKNKPIWNYMRATCQSFYFWVNCPFNTVNDDSAELHVLLGRALPVGALWGEQLGDKWLDLVGRPQGLGFNAQEIIRFNLASRWLRDRRRNRSLDLRFCHSAAWGELRVDRRTHMQRFIAQLRKWATRHIHVNMQTLTRLNINNHYKMPLQAVCSLVQLGLNWNTQSLGRYTAMRKEQALNLL